MGSQSGRYAATSRLAACHGYMFSTAKTTSVSSRIRPTPVTKLRAYSRCHRNGGCTTTVEAPSASAASFDRTSLAHGSVPQTRWVISRQGAWMASTGTP